MVGAVEGAHECLFRDRCCAAGGEDVEGKGGEWAGWEDLQIVCGKRVTDRLLAMIRNNKTTLQYSIPHMKAWIPGGYFVAHFQTLSCAEHKDVYQ